VSQGDSRFMGYWKRNGGKMNNKCGFFSNIYLADLNNK
jgi:hypothetical protein